MELFHFHCMNAVVYDFVMKKFVFPLEKVDLNSENRFALINEMGGEVVFEKNFKTIENTLHPSEASFLPSNAHYFNEAIEAFAPFFQYVKSLEEISSFDEFVFKKEKFHDGYPYPAYNATFTIPGFREELFIRWSKEEDDLYVSLESSLPEKFTDDLPKFIQITGFLNKETVRSLKEAIKKKSMYRLRLLSFL